MSEQILVVRCGTRPLRGGVRGAAPAARAPPAREIPDVLLLLEHPPVYTRGRRSTPEELPMGVEWYEAQGIEVRDTDRGGRVTYHGPGQLVAYPIVIARALRRRRARVRAQARAGDDRGARRPRRRGADDRGADRGLDRGRAPGGPCPASATRRSSCSRGRRRREARKIGSIGIHISRGVTTHGLAVNVNNDLQPFEWVVPCGIEGCAVTSLTRELGAEQDLDAFAAALTDRFGEVFEPHAGRHRRRRARPRAGDR